MTNNMVTAQFFQLASHFNLSLRHLILLPRIHNLTSDNVELHVKNTQSRTSPSKCSFITQSYSFCSLLGSNFIWQAKSLGCIVANTQTKCLYSYLISFVTVIGLYQCMWLHCSVNQAFALFSCSAYWFHIYMIAHIPGSNILFLQTSMSQETWSKWKGFKFKFPKKLSALKNQTRYLGLVSWKIINMSVAKVAVTLLPRWHDLSPKWLSPKQYGNSKWNLVLLNTCVYDWLLK
jgi:hypothetical protein